MHDGDNGAVAFQMLTRMQVEVPSGPRTARVQANRLIINGDPASSDDDSDADTEVR